jgi:hypothetical protein
MVSIVTPIETIRPFAVLVFDRKFPLMLAPAQPDLSV